jgi:hypothetical protein
MKRYLLSVYQPAGDPPPPDVLGPIVARLDALDAELRDAGAKVFSGGLHDPSTATVVRASEGDVVMTDGPFVEAKEHLGGLTIVQAEDLDEALAWGRRLAEATTLPIEVRPFQD